MCVSVSRLGCVYQSPSNGRTSARRSSSASVGDLELAPAVQVDRALVDGRGRAARCRRRRSARRTRCRRSRPRRGPRCAARTRRAGNSSARRGTNVPSGRSRSSPAPTSTSANSPPARPEHVAVGGLQRRLVRGAQQVRGVELLVLVVEDRGLDRALEELVGVAAEELVERVLAGDVDRQPAPAPPGAAPHLAQRGDRPRERHADRRVQRADVDPQLQRVGRDDAEQLAVDQPRLELAPLLRRVARPVGRDPLAPARGARAARARAPRSAPSARPPCATS